MKLFCLLTFLVVAFASAHDESKPGVSPHLVSEINSNPKSTWKAGHNPRFANVTMDNFKRLLGTIMPGEPGYQGAEQEKTLFSIKDSDIPTNFDLRTAQSACAPIIGMVRDQSNCGSCWAFGSTEAFNDRHCIATGDAKTVLSPEDTAACCTGRTCQFSMGCNGGQPAGAWNWFTKDGVCTGGNYEDVGTGTTCKPYTLESCAHHSDPEPGQKSCEDIESYKTPKCTSTCSESGYTTPYKDDKMKAKSSYSVKGVSNMQKELMEKGTLSVALSVYEDFEAYTGGVYQHTSGKYLGGHAVKMIGWGVDADTNTPYWLCVNSWNYGWGEQGLFRILRGSDECGIESSVVAGDV
jgi:cathepsin B